MVWGICYPQEADSILKKDPNIISYPETITFRLGFSNEFNSFEVADRTSNFEATISPNQQLKSTFSFLFRFLEIEFAYTPTFLKFNHDDAIKGETEFFNMGTRFYVAQWMQNFEITKTKGYYIASKDLGFPEADNVIFPDLKVFKVGGSTSYVFNKDFSFRAIFKQTEWQRRSSGSFVPRLNYYYTEFRDKNRRRDKNLDIAVGPAYFYNWIINRKFLVSVGAYAGIGYSHIRSSGFEANTPNTSFNRVNYQSDFTAALGYNTASFFTGVNVSLKSVYHRLDTDFSIDDQQQFFEFHIGYRLDAPKNILQKAKELERKIGL